MKKRLFYCGHCPWHCFVGMLSGGLSGCAGTAQDRALSILTPNQNIEPLLDKLTAEDSDITFDVRPYFGSGVSVHIQERFKNNDLPDIIMATYAPEDSIQKETLLDLSGYGFVQNYKASVLTNLSVDGGIYMLEGPSVVRGIGYNKTLFAEQGLECPYKPRGVYLPDQNYSRRYRYSAFTLPGVFWYLLYLDEQIIPAIS